MEVGVLISTVPFVISSSDPCGTSFIAGCISRAVITVCGNTNDISCVCNTSGQSALGSIVAPCLLSKCGAQEIVSLGGLAFSACDQWLSTHLLTTTGDGLTVTTTRPITASSTFSSVTKSSGPGDMSITSSPTSGLPASITSKPTPSSSPSPLPGGAKIGIGIGAAAVAGLIILGIFLCLRKRRAAAARQSPSHSEHELQTDVNVAELPDKPAEGYSPVQVVEIPPAELQGFEFPFQKQPYQKPGEMEPMEADSHSVRAGRPRGRQVGTEATAFDFESQKVIRTPDMRGYSPAQASMASSMRRLKRAESSETGLGGG